MSATTPDPTIATADTKRDSAFHGVIELEVVGKIDGDGYDVADRRVGLGETRTVQEYMRDRLRPNPPVADLQTVGYVAYDVFKDEVLSFRGCWR